MRKSLLLLAAIGVCSGLFAQQPPWQPDPSLTTLTLWPNGAPGATPNPGPENLGHVNPVAGSPIIFIGNVSKPTVTYYPARAKNTEVGIVVFPGGGYRHLAIDLEGTEVCEWLNSIGINCILLKYRVPDSGPYPQSSAALQDAQRALSMVRSHATEWHIDPHRIGVLGFSAGAHLAAALSTHFDQRLYDPIDAADQASCRPDFALILYPGEIALNEPNFPPSPDLVATDKTPPAFIVQAEDDGVHVENAINYFMILKKAKVPAEMHIYAEGGHGYGLRHTDKPVTTWPQTAAIWLHTIKVLPPTAP